MAFGGSGDASGSGTISIVAGSGKITRFACREWGEVGLLGRVGAMTAVAATFVGLATIGLFGDAGGLLPPGMAKRERGSGWLTRAGVPRLSAGVESASFWKNTRNASLADSGRSCGARLISHMIHSQAQIGMSARTSCSGTTR